MAEVSLMDIVPVTKLVPIGNDQQLAAHGIGIEAAMHLFNRFPELKNLTNGKVEEVKPERIFEVAPRAIAAIIAAGANMANDQKAEKKAAILPLQIQLDFIQAVIERTMPDGPGPFLERLMMAMAVGKGLVSGLQEGARGVGPAQEPLEPTSQTPSPG
jgi:hypothetical protein